MTKQALFRSLFLIPIWLSSASAQDSEFPTQEAPDPIRTYDCDPSCSDTHFCGRDLQCHPYSCEAWYKLAHPFFTRYSPETSEELNCQDMVEDRTFLSETVVCRSGMPLGSAFFPVGKATTNCYDPDREDQLASYQLTRKCTAQPADDTGFVCYDISPNTDFDAHTAAYVQQSQEKMGQHSYKLYVFGYTEGTNVDSSTYPIGIGEIRSLGEAGDRSTFNATAARAAMYSRAFDLQDNPMLPQCPNGCLLSEFCGRDGVCHDINCDNFWQYGPQDYTGREEGDDSLLNCSQELQESSANPCDTGWPAVVQYYCKPANVFSGVNYCLAADGPRHLSFHRMCTAQPTPTQEFVCFDLKEVPNLDDFVAEYIENTTTNPNCTEAEQYSESHPVAIAIDVGPIHHQTHRVESHQLNHHASTSLYNWVPYSRESLDMEALDYAMLSRVEGSPPSPSPDEGTGSAAVGWNLTPWLATGLLIGTCCI